jgi:hypothetical protein
MMSKDKDARLSSIDALQYDVFNQDLDSGLKTSVDQLILMKRSLAGLMICDQLKNYYTF